MLGFLGVISDVGMRLTASGLGADIRHDYYDSCLS